ncbi:hypothetical protein V1525DRAFT_450210 [Lipomyces kononenkoae]|uniref:Uncharacterized protein n=1 Tax=Lipomyces kononenkoae TaxID=34357 RepID=A0ACC3T1P7_LIPKO
MAPNQMQYKLQVSAAPSYDPAVKQTVYVNTDTPTVVVSPSSESSIVVRIQNFSGLPDGSPKTNAYFGHRDHMRDLYSISFMIKFKEDTSFDDVLFGNDFDRPIRDNLPYGFGIAYKIFHYMIDPSAEGDVYADKPYLYGYAVTSINAITVAQPNEEFQSLVKEDMSTIVHVDGHDIDIPPSAGKRRKFFLKQENRKKYIFRAGETYKFDFFNPYIEMGSEFALRLPGYSLAIMKYWDGQPLRYVLKSKSGKVYFTLLFELVDIGS